MPVEPYVQVLLLAAVVPLAAMAADAPKATPPALTAADAELLEFLGEFDDAKGEFVDPFVIDAVSTVVDDAEREAQRAAKRDARSHQPPAASPAPPVGGAEAATQAPNATPPEKTP